MVSEIMLQQTQVNRVLTKYTEFLTLFPDVQALAAAPLSQVLVTWSGLGYNRRAKFLWQAAQMIVADFSGIFPTNIEQLQKLPGIGANTAGAIVAYSYNQPVIFIETNIRTVFIHHFFANQPEAVHDKQILELTKETLDQEHPREWYWALMDYGTHLKQTVGNLSRNSKSYARQSKFEGSLRQVRGTVIRLLATEKQTEMQLATTITDDRLPLVLQSLEQEKLIQKTNNTYHLAGS
jgi:A/G-specific adenine glycosylase